jgi:SAM-dependent methyltransferase
MYYDKDYFDWQKNMGAFGGTAELFKFEKYITSQDNVLDFGCGGGYLLHNLNCKRKVGIEINDTARIEIVNSGICAVKYPSDVEDNFADVLISNHALEHVESPYHILKELYPKLKYGGKVIFVVPHQKPSEKYIENDINNHLYTWNPLTLGNLFKQAGYKVQKVDVIRHRWPPFYTKVRSACGFSLFNTVCKMYAYFRVNYQIRIVAIK